MVRVSIDVPALRGVITGLGDVVDLVFDEWSAVASAAGRGLTVVSALNALGEHTSAITASASDLQARVDLAVLVNGGDRSSWDGPVSYDVPADTPEGTREQIGIEFADAFGDLPSDPRDREDVEHLGELAQLLDRYQDDEDVTNTMFDRLGPEGALRVPEALKYFADAYSRNLMSMGSEDLFWDDDTHMMERIQQLQQQFMESYGNALATSSNSSAFDDGFAQDLVTVVTGDNTTLGWGLSQILRHGTYEADFLTTIGTGLYDWEKEQDGRVWGGRFDGDLDTWTLGTEGGDGYYDPFVGLFEAMGRTPEAALDFINPGGEEAVERAQYIIQDRTWAHDDFNSLGIMLDAAATSFRDHDDPQSARAAWVASATIHFLAERDEGRNGRAIGDAGKDSLGHILATYISDVDRIANGPGGSFGTYDPLQSVPWEDGLPIGADFEYDHLRDVMQEVLTDDDAVAQIAHASAEWNAYRMNVAAADWDGDVTDMSRVQAAVDRSSALNGFVLGAMEVGTEAEAREADERAQMYLDIASDVVGLVPTGGTFTSFLADQALSQGKDAVASHFTNNESRVQGENLTVQQVAVTDLQIAMALALAENDHLPPDAMKNEDGRTYPWFEGGVFDASVVETPQMRAQFIDWLTHGDAGQAATALLPDIDGEFRSGLDRGGDD
ncbi:MAG: DUF6571 family protein [Jiangellaceae bacterium]